MKASIVNARTYFAAIAALKVLMCVCAFVQLLDTSSQIVPKWEKVNFGKWDQKFFLRKGMDFAMIIDKFVLTY